MFGLSPLLPAYGRDYKSLEEAQKDFEAGKDFQTPMGKYANRQDVIGAGLTTIQVRFNKRRNTGMLKVN